MCRSTWTLLLAMLLAANAAQAQDVRIYGVVRAYEANVPLQGAIVRVSVGTLPLVTMQCDSIGRYEVVLDVGRTYQLSYEAPGHVSKNVQVDLTTTPKDDGGYGMSVDVRLFPPVPGVDVSFLVDPIGKAAYDSTSQNIAWDMDYTAPLMQRLNTLFPPRYTIEEPVETLQADTL